MRYSNEDIAAVVELVALHLRFHTYQMGWTDSAVRRYVRDAGDLLAELNVLTRCDCTTRNERKAAQLSRRMDDLEVRIADLQSREELAAIRPELDGNAVMELLGVPPGRVVGEALAFLLEIRLDEGLLGDDEIRRRLLDVVGRERSLDALLAWRAGRGRPADTRAAGTPVVQLVDRVEVEVGAVEGQVQLAERAAVRPVRLGNGAVVGEHPRHRVGGGDDERRGRA